VSTAGPLSSPRVSAPDAPHALDIGAVRELVKTDMERVNGVITDCLRSEVALINQVGAYITGKGGKRLRPAVVLLSAGAFDYRGEAHTVLAAVIELIHTATLLHDDVVDASDLRRGQPTANEVWGNSASVLVGDFLYSRAFELMVSVDNMRVMAIMARTTNTIAEGEVMQLLNCHSPDIDEGRYLETIRCKTAKLFESAAQLGAVLSGRDAAIEKSMASYGLHLGTAFQLVDDVLDYTAATEDLGKNIGDDLAEGKPTLPVIRAMAVGNPAQRKLLRQAIENGGLDHIEAVLDAIESTGALAYTSARARDHAERAKESLEALPVSTYRRALEGLADFAVERDH
jgi:octaprenyl-diphosphate synthase